MIVVDASAALAALLNDGPARQALAAQALHAPHLIDSEVASGVRRLVSRARLDPGRLDPGKLDPAKLDARTGWTVLDTWRRLGVIRHPGVGLLERVWDLRDNLSAYDASYIALAEQLGCDLLTADASIARAHGPRCPVTVVPR